jgi:hypothetical protein
VEIISGGEGAGDNLEVFPALSIVWPRQPESPEILAKDQGCEIASRLPPPDCRLQRRVSLFRRLDQDAEAFPNCLLKMYHNPCFSQGLDVFGSY